MDKNKIAIDLFNKLASGYQEKFMNVNLYGDTFDFFCQAIEKKNAEVLEIACGPGNITKYLLTKRPDLRILGTDMAPNMIDLARINNPAATFEVMDCRDIGNLNKTYDAIMCGFCLPYLSMEQTAKLIQDTFKLLEVGGVLYLSTMEDDYSNSQFKKGSTGEEIFMHYYMETDLTEILKKNGFTIVDLQRKEYEGKNGEKTVDLIIIAEKVGQK